MDILSAMRVSGTGLAVQRAKMHIISTNLANAYTTRTPEGGPYRRQIPVLEAKTMEDESGSGFSSVLQSVEVVGIKQDQSPLREVYDPGHPDADANGKVQFPNVNVIAEMTDMMVARRSYEANAAAIKAAKQMALKALELGK